MRTGYHAAANSLAQPTDEWIHGLMNENFYQIMGIPRDSDERQIKRAYHRLARELHPDKAKSADDARKVEVEFAAVSTAYNVLKDLVQRAEYDRKTFGEEGYGSPQNGASSPAASPAASAAPPAPPSGAKKAAAPSRAAADQNISAQRVAIAQKAYVRGMQFAKEGDHAKAVEFFEAAISNNKAEPSYHARLGLSLIEAKKSASRAIEAARTAIELDTYNLDFKFNLAHIYETIGSKSNAIKVYEEILKWDADNQMATQMLREINKKDNFLSKLTEGSSFLNKLFKK